jgi:hypothetical protein
MKKVYLTLLGCYLAICGYSQAVVMTPNFSGGFENGGSFAANSWTEVNGPFNRWAVGTGSVNSGTRGAYIGNTTTYTGTNNAATNHFYRNTFNLPAGATNALLTFRYRQPVTDAGNDSLIVSIGLSSAATPGVGATVSPAYTRLFQNTATAHPGYVEVGPIDISALANNNLRLVFTHVNNGFGPNGIPAIDSVSLNYCPAITGTLSMCPGGSVNLACPNPTGSAWSSSDASVASVSASTGTTATIDGISAGTATITHVGGTCTVTATVTVQTPVVPTVTIGSSASGTICAGTAVTYTATPTNEGTTPTYEWYVNDISAATGTGYSYVPSNGDIVRVTLRPGGICVDPDSATTTQTQIITPLAAPGVTIAVAPSNPSCLGRPVTFSATPMLGGSAPGYRWTKNGVNVATGPTYTYVPATGDMVYCVMTSNYQCRNVDTGISNMISMTTQASAPLAVIDINATPGTTVAPGTMVVLSATRTGGGTSTVNYQWHINGTEVPGATDAIYGNDSYVNGDIVTCKVINTDPCANFSLTSIVINTTGAGVSTINTDRKFVVVPNPNNGSFTLLGKVAETVAGIRVTNITGQTVYNSTVQIAGQELNEKLNLGTLPAGLYIITVNTTSGANTLHFSVR